MAKRIVLFLVLNFLALAIGGFFTGDGVPSEWYQTLNKAPWTPPGWVFGAAWTTIMICFSIYMAVLFSRKEESKRKTIALYIVQWVLNVVWNPVFFKWNNVTLGLISITLLTLLITFMLFKDIKTMKSYSILLFPYAIWLIIATSLNAYILIYN